MPANRKATALFSFTARSEGISLSKFNNRRLLIAWRLSLPDFPVFGSETWRVIKLGLSDVIEIQCFDQRSTLSYFFFNWNSFYKFKDLKQTFNNSSEKQPLLEYTSDIYTLFMWLIKFTKFRLGWLFARLPRCAQHIRKHNIKCKIGITIHTAPKRVFN